VGASVAVGTAVAVGSIKHDPPSSESQIGHGSDSEEIQGIAVRRCPCLRWTKATQTLGEKMRLFYLNDQLS
jgi:hypothetical protein